jgi:regulator of protease activity HflC (stomatin/prohibitin superfamily)
MSAAMANHVSQEPNGPVAQSIRIAFGVLQVATVALALFWVASNVSQVPPGTQAVVLRFGRIARVQQSGLMVAWPRPIERVELLPSTERQLDLRIAAEMKAGPAIVDPVSAATGEAPPATAGIYLTGDGGVVLLDATLTYRIDDAEAYYLEAAHVAPVLRRLFLASAVAVAAGRGMDDFLVVRGGSGKPEIADQQSRREDLRGALVREINRRLRALAPQRANPRIATQGIATPGRTPGPASPGSGSLDITHPATPSQGIPSLAVPSLAVPSPGISSLGIEVTRADVTALLPPAAKFAFDAVLDATQMAEQGLAGARTDATRAQQRADQERDRVLTEARANADERVATAKAHVAAITALEQRMAPSGRPSLLDQLYRERIAGILKEAGAVSTVDMRGGGRLILPAGPTAGSPGGGHP